MSQIGMENFNGYDGSNPNFMLAKTTKTKVPPGGSNTYAPGSPKPMKDVDQEYEMSAANMAKLRPNLAGLGISPRLMEKEQMLNEQNGTLATNVDEDVKDATIKHLNRHATMLQARVHQLETVKDKLETALKETEQELVRAKEHIVALSQTHGRPIGQQRNQNIDVAAYETNIDGETLRHELHSLRMENSSLKKKEESLLRELHSLRESMVSLEHSPSLMSTQACNRELEGLHKVVDSLRSTVKQQRNFLLKLKAPQTAISLPAETRAAAKAGANGVAGTGNFQDQPRLRQGEEGTASPYPEQSDPVVRNSSNPLRQSKSSGFPVSGTTTGSPKGLDVSNKNAQESVMHLAGLDVYDRLSAVHGGGFSDNAMEDDDNLGSNLMYVNSINDVPARAHSNSPKPSNRSAVAQSAPLKRDPPPSTAPTQYQKEQRAQDRPVRKISQTEIIRQGPAPSLPVRSKTENLGLNPQRKSSQATPDVNIQWRPAAHMSKSASRQPDDAAQQRWQEPSVSSSLTKPASTTLSQTPVQSSAQSSHYNMRPQQWPLYSNTIGGCAMDVVRRQDLAAIVRTTPDGGSSNFDTVDGALPHSPRERLDSDKLCPVCNRYFEGLSIDAFQSHVLECFDNESGPETIVADNSSPQPQRVCPMCNTSFRDDMSQSEFEKHVNSHFEEDLPGDNFEIIKEQESPQIWNSPRHH